MSATLVLKMSDLYLAVSRHRGWGEGPAGGGKWNARQMGVLKDCVDSGLRNFYRPPPIGNTESYHWSFLTPVGQVTIEVPASDSLLPVANMPNDFGGFISKLTISAGSAIYTPLQVVNEAFIREKFATNPSTTGRPLMAADVAIKGTTATAGPRRQLLVYPRPDQSYTFKFQYKLLPEALSESEPYPYGAQEHSETILESCLRMSEERYDNVKDGLHSQKFFECLAASVSLDRAHKPHLIGYNADQSDALESDRRWRADYWQPVTYNGLPMESY